MLTARDDHDWPLQKAGHASLVETPAGEAYLVHLCSRPLATHQHRRCMLGRETAIQRVRWTDDGWLRLADGGRHPQLTVPAPPLPPHPFAPEPERDEFDGPGLGLPFQSLRRPVDAGWADLTARPGWLRLRGGESLHSRHRQSLIARRVQHFHCEAETLLDFAPQDFQQMAGLIAIYDARVWHYLQVTRDEERGRLLLPVSSLDGDYREMRDAAVVLPETGPVALRVTIARRDLRFAYRIGRGDWQPVGSVLDATVLSDEYGNGLHFTGAFVGLCCQDLSGRAQPADFDSFAYRGRP
jgi:xylan 1,4-beta-xylosidase